MLFLRSLFAALSFFSVFASAAPVSVDSELVKRDDTLSQLLQIALSLDTDIQNLNSDFSKLASDVNSDLQNDLSLITSALNLGNSTVAKANSGTTLAKSLAGTNPTGQDVENLISAFISLIKDLLSLIPVATTFIINEISKAQGDLKTLLAVPHEVIQAVLGLASSLSSVIPGFGTAVSVFINLLKAGDNILYGLL